MPSPVKNFTDTPPGSPANGDRYVAGTSPTGPWSDEANQYQTYLGSAWESRMPIAGDVVFDQTAKKLKTYENSAWSNLGFGVAYTFADSTARTATGTYYSEDVGKLAWQQSDDTVWLLKTVTSPGASATPTWVQVGGTSATVNAVKDSVRVASTANVTISSPGSTIDGVTMASGDRVLLKDQSTGSQNGIYVWNGAASAMTRATDFDTSAEVQPNVVIGVQEGTANADKRFQLTTNAPITLATTALTFTEFGGGSSANATSIQGVSVSATSPTNGQVLGYNGSVWIPTTLSGSTDFALSISNQTIPTVTSGVLTGFSWRNQGACTATDRSPVGASFEYPTGSSDSIRGMDKTAGSTIAEMWFRRVQASGASRMFLYARSSGGAYRTIGVNASGNLVVEVWTSDTGYTGTTGSSVTLTVNGILLGVRFTISGGNIDALYSLDGVFWYALATGISFTPAQFGVGIWSNGLTYGGVHSFYTA